MLLLSLRLIIADNKNIIFGGVGLLIWKTLLFTVVKAGKYVAQVLKNYAERNHMYISF